MSDHQSTSQPDNPTSITVTLSSDETDAQTQDVATVRLKLKKPKSRKKVNWTEGTVDNENMDKKKSKCCCIYQKPHAPEESSSDTDDECEHCHGHVENKNKKASTNDPGQPPADPPVQSMIAA